MINFDVGVGYWYRKCGVCGQLRNLKQERCPAHPAADIYPYYSPKEIEMPTVRYSFSTIPLIFVIGATNAGKSTLLDAVRSYPGVGVVEVGKMFRAKYPPEHFKGHANPAHTAKEAWQMFADSVTERAADGCRVAFVDGQPRDLEQCEAVLALPNPKRFLHLWAPILERQRRAMNRDDDPTVPCGENMKLQLALARVVGDIPKLYDVVQRIRTAEYPRMDPHLFDCDTTDPNYIPFGAASLVLEALTGERL